ncbi:MAG: GNAT family N-acetyltransferase [Gammaproteobacteria bacterium]|nr:GNAT family N-acetyltransferase [Gammaproteobacteria bacterium]
MFKSIKEFFSTKDNVLTEVDNSVVIKSADFLDSDFIFNQIIEGSKSGHFNSAFVIPRYHLGIKKQIEDSVKSNSCETVNGIVSSRFYVASINDDLVGFYWVIRNKPSEFEIYMLSVAPKNRKKGIGSELLSHSLKSIPKGSTMVARLYSASTVMLTMIYKVGFKKSKKQNAKETVKLSIKTC